MRQSIIPFVGMALTALSLVQAARADTSEVVVPGKMADPRPLENLSASYFMNLGLGDVLSFTDGRDGRRIADFRVPSDDPAFEVPNHKLRFFSKGLTALTARFENLQGDQGTDEAAHLDVLRVIRGLEDRRVETFKNHHVLFVGSPVQLTDDPGFSMQDDQGQLRIPSDAHITSSLKQTPFGRAATGKPLDGLTVHFCVTDRDSRTSFQDHVLMRFWNQYLFERGSALASWTDDLSICFDRFKGRKLNRIDVADLDSSSPFAMVDVGGDVGQRSPTKAGPDVFNLFSSAHHPTITGLLVYTGIEYNPGDYPGVYTHAWCYAHIVNEDGAQVRLNIGSKSPGEMPTWDVPTARSLRASGVSRSDFDRSREACLFPTS